MVRLLDNNYKCYNHDLLCYYTVPARCYATSANNRRYVPPGTDSSTEMPEIDALPFRCQCGGARAERDLASPAGLLLRAAAGCRLQNCNTAKQGDHDHHHNYTDTQTPTRLDAFSLPKPRRARHGRRARWTAAASDRQGSVRQTPTQTCYRAMQNRNVILPAHKE